MTTLSKAEAPIFASPEQAETRSDRNGWIAVFLAAALAATLIAFAHRVDPQTLPVEPGLTLLE